MNFTQLSKFQGSCVLALSLTVGETYSSTSSRFNFDYIEVTGEDASCKATPLSLRQFFYDNFRRATREMSHAQKNETARRYAKLLAMAIKESSGNAANVTDMQSHGSSRSDRLFFGDNPRASMRSLLQVTLRTRADLLSQKGVTINKQTNYGLLQMSADRLTNSKNIAIYKKYQNMAQSAPRSALAVCGTEYLYRDAANVLAGELEDAASCSATYRTTDGVKCFGQMLTICPALNFELALVAPAAYFATRKATPRCEGVFRDLIESAAY